MCRGVLFIPAMRLAHGQISKYWKLISGGCRHIAPHCSLAFSGYIDNRPSEVRTSPIKMPSLISSNLAASGGKGKNQKADRSERKSKSKQSYKKNKDGRKTAAPGTKKMVENWPPLKFFCIIAASLSLMGTNTIRLRHNCDVVMKPFRQKINFYQASEPLTIACVANKIV